MYVCECECAWVCVCAVQQAIQHQEGDQQGAIEGVLYIEL